MAIAKRISENITVGMNWIGQKPAMKNAANASQKIRRLRVANALD